MRRLPRFSSEIIFLIKVVLAGLAVFALVRAGFLLRNWGSAVDVPFPIIIRSFLVGARFDLVVVSYLMFPLTLWLLLPRYGWQYSPLSAKYIPWVIALTVSPLVFLSVIEWEFYREFHDRFNQLALQYITDDPATVLSMIWHGYPVLRYVALWTVLTALIVYGLKQMIKGHVPAVFQRDRHFRRVLPAGLFVLVLLILGSRGGFQPGPALRWGDAYFSKYTFANHLALNGVFTLSRTVLELKRHDLAKSWMNKVPEAEALELTRKMVMQPGDRMINEDSYPLLRYQGRENRTLDYAQTPRNVVLIIMESFSAEFTGALGASYGAMPNFDRLAQKGILFDHFFSQGTHTHQGLFASTCSFPNLPGYEYLMQNSLGQQPIRSIITMMHEQGAHSIYVYNGSFTWDNQEGFFRNQGIKHFVGQNDFVNAKFKDSTWGVSDEDVFLRGVEEIRSLSTEGPVFAIIQTLNNHAPFELPPPAPFHDLNGPENLLPRLNGIRYSDWALGQFFSQAEKEPWFHETLFVIVGDHGFAYNPPLAPLDLSAFHVPLLLYYPGDAGRNTGVVHTVASQVDIMPTVLGLMKNKGVHQAWGRDLFRLAPDDPGWAVVKPSGTRQVAGYLQGDLLLIVSPEMKPVIYRVRFNPWNAEQIQLQPGPLKELSRSLYSYVQTALRALTTRRAGFVPDGG